MRWVTGYLDDNELIYQLKVWRAMLQRKEESARNHQIESAIVVLDNITKDDEQSYTMKDVFVGQQVRSQE